MTPQQTEHNASARKEKNAKLDPKKHKHGKKSTRNEAKNTHRKSFFA